MMENNSEERIQIWHNTELIANNVLLIVYHIDTDKRIRVFCT